MATRTRKLEIEIVADASAVRGEMDDAAKSVGKLDKAVDKLDDSSKDAGDRLEGLGETADRGETRIMGMKDSVDGMATVMKGPGEQGIAAYLQGWADLSSGIANFAIPALMKARDAVMGTAKTAVTAAAEHGKAVALQIANWVKLGIQSLLHAAKVAAAWLIAMGPIAIVGAAVIGLVALIIANWEHVSKFLKAAWEGIKDVAAKVWDGIQKAIDTVVRAITTIFLNFTVPGLIIKHWETIKRVTTAAWNFVKSAVLGAVNAIVGFFQALPGRIGGALGQLGNQVWAAFRAGINFVTGLVRAGVQAWIDIHIGIPLRLFHALANLGNRIWDAFRGAFEYVGRLIRGRIDSVIGFFERIPSGLERIFSGLANVLTTPFEVAFGAIKRAWNATVGGFGFTIPSWVPGLGGKGFRIPSMASGGIVPGAFGTPQMILAHAGELVLNPRQQQALGSGAPVVHVYLDGDDVTQYVRTRLIRIGNRNDGRILSVG